MEMEAKILTPRFEEASELELVEKFAWATPGENMKAASEKINGRLRSYAYGITLATLTQSSDKPRTAGSQFSFRFNWNGNLKTLTSWEKGTNHGWTHQLHNPRGNTGFMVGVGVIPEFRGYKVNHNLHQLWPKKYKISELLIAYTLHKLFYDGVQQVIANARIPWYHKKPHLSPKEYCQLRQQDGRRYDPVLRFHERMGAKIIKPVTFSMEDDESLDAGCWVLYCRPFQG